MQHKSPIHPCRTNIDPRTLAQVSQVSGQGHDQGFSFKLSGWCDIHTKSASDQIKEG